MKSSSERARESVANAALFEVASASGSSGHHQGNFLIFLISAYKASKQAVSCCRVFTRAKVNK